MDPTTLLFAKVASVAIGALFSWAMIDLVVSNQLQFYLADQKFELLVIIGGVLLGIMVLLKMRALALQSTAHHHHHDHGHGYGHSHDHAHDDHSHSVSLWRLAVLVFPLVIVLAGMAPKGLSSDIFEKRMTQAQRDAIANISSSGLPPERQTAVTSAWSKLEELRRQLEQVRAEAKQIPKDIEATREQGKADKKAATREKELSARLDQLPTIEDDLERQVQAAEKSLVVVVDARRLQAEAASPTGREFWESTTKPVLARIAGQFVPDKAGRFSDRFQLMRIKITCCAADATPVGANVVGRIDPSWTYGQWLEVLGAVTFIKVPNSNSGIEEYMPVVNALSIEKTEEKPYIQ